MESSINLTIIKLIGYVSSLMTVFLWLIFIFINPYAEITNRSTLVISIIMLLLMHGVISNRCLFKQKSANAACIYLEFSYSLYMLLTPGIFRLFGITSLMYLLCFVLFRMNKIRY